MCIYIYIYVYSVYIYILCISKHKSTSTPHPMAIPHPLVASALARSSGLAVGSRPRRMGLANFLRNSCRAPKTPWRSGPVIRMEGPQQQYHGTAMAMLIKYHGKISWSGLIKYDHGLFISFGQVSCTLSRIHHVNSEVGFLGFGKLNLEVRVIII